MTAIPPLAAESEDGTVPDGALPGAASPQGAGALTDGALLDLLPAGVAVLDPDHRILRCNPAFTAALALEQGSRATPDLVSTAQRAAAARHRRIAVSSRDLPTGGSMLCAVDTTDAMDETARALDRKRTALATLRIGVGAFAADGTLMFGNPRLAELFGLPATALGPGVTFGDLLDAMAHAPGFATLDGTAFLAAQAAVDRTEASSVRVTGTTGTVIEVASDPLPGGGWTVTVADVSPLAGAEEEARGRAAALDAILAAIPHGICVFGADQRMAMSNPAYAQVMAGAPIAVGEHLSDVILRRAETGEYGEGRVEDVMAQQCAFDLSRPQMRQRRRPNGTVIDVRTAPLPDGGHVSVVTDVTPLTQAKAEVSRHASAMEVMLGSIRHGILFWDANRRLIAANDIAAALLGHPPGLLAPGRSQDDILDHMIARKEWGDGEAARAMIDSLRNRDRSTPYRRHLTTRAGRVLDARSDPAPGGGWISTFTDVTDTVKVQEELRRAKDAAEAANQAKSRFLATMSHELRTPLNAVIGFSDALLREGHQPASERVAEFAQQINDAGRQLLGLINIILDVARIESGRFDLTIDRVDVGTLIRDAIRQTDAAAQAAEISLAYELPDELPVLRADERRLQQVLAHLLSNAIKFTDAGGTVTVGAAMESDGTLLIYVRDTGIGIPEGDIERVFEPFTQLDSTLSRRFQGAGIGLYVARALVLGHGGRLVLRSVPGAGTTAELRLPARHLV
ncbi:MAG: PAS-domain containing protein [Acetobacteraceae bacterium]|nr:PAS-domain containing protein [Acetobacteraceae bacterium]